MLRTLRTRRGRSPNWQRGLCIALVAFMLYNPFAGLWSANHGLSYDRLARNRATVGASELQHFSPITNATAQTEADVNLPSGDLLPVVREQRPHIDLEVVFTPIEEFLTQLWNRPPPSL